MESSKLKETLANNLKAVLGQLDQLEKQVAAAQNQAKQLEAQRFRLEGALEALSMLEHQATPEEVAPAEVPQTTEAPKA